MFRKNIEPSCTYCARGEMLSDGSVVCKHFGLISPQPDCRKFAYAPLKRVPQRPPVLPEFSEEDFSI